ncbi:MAG: response regulator transcription factor [Demequina sp.]|uniref:response regulator transcription factor n=1 Tax=Demequina sp. TaxID=2050685 RepID=UPI003A83CF6D
MRREAAALEDPSGHHVVDAAPRDAEPAGGPRRDRPEQAAARADGLDQWELGLTEREREVAALVVQGLPNRDVARHLYMSVRTVEVHLGRVYRKLGLKSRVELVMLAHGGGTAG